MTRDELFQLVQGACWENGILSDKSEEIAHFVVDNVDFDESESEDEHGD